MQQPFDGGEEVLKNFDIFSSNTTSFVTPSICDALSKHSMFDNDHFIINGEKVFVPILAPSVPRDSKVAIFRMRDGPLVLVPVATAVPEESTTPAVAAATVSVPLPTSSFACPVPDPTPASSSKPGSPAPVSTPSL
ncbi:hypothetical protein BGZ70_006579 [Mortierella alpina]|uniref:Uncharacterized protein n=1 Tax=Mortierella alpina TaxID=64518 RepID=A0A9P6JB34_MORAP|nr:hypothetical protein BGZ70_006579 [Mortierella alpina]